MNDVLAFLMIAGAEKIGMLVVAGWMFFLYYKMRQRNLVQPWIFFAIGLSLYGVAAEWTWGWLQYTQIIMMLLCSLGMLIAQWHSQREAQKKMQYFEERSRQFDEVLAKYQCGAMTDDEVMAFLRQRQREREEMMVQR